MQTKRDFTKIFENPLAWLVTLILLFAVPLYFSFKAPQPELPPALGNIPNFELTNQDGRNISYANEYKGSVLLVNFIFTSCQTVCPLLTAQMAKIQSRLQSAAPIIRLVSITVDPETDTPEVLKKYGEKYQARFRHWSFLTGDLNQIYETVVNGFHIAADNPVFNKADLDSDKSADLFEITHGEHFVIIDQQGQIRAYMQGNNDEQLNKIVQTLSLVANTKPENATISIVR